MGKLNKEKAKEIFAKAITGQVVPSSSLEAETDAGQVLSCGFQGLLLGEPFQVHQRKGS